MRYSQACTLEALLHMQGLRGTLRSSLHMGEQLRRAWELQTLPRTVVLYVHRFVLRILPGNFNTATTGQRPS